MKIGVLVQKTPRKRLLRRLKHCQLCACKYRNVSVVGNFLRKTINLQIFHLAFTSTTKKTQVNVISLSCLSHSILNFHKLLLFCRNLRRCTRRMFEVWYSCELGDTQTSGRFRTTWLRKGKSIDLKLILLLNAYRLRGSFGTSFLRD